MTRKGLLMVTPVFTAPLAFLASWLGASDEVAVTLFLIGISWPAIVAIGVLLRERGR